VNGELIAAIDQSFQYSVGMGSLALSADGRTLAVVGHGPIGSQFSTFRLDVATKKVTPLARDVNFGGASMSASALSADGERIAIGTKLEGALLVVDAQTGSVLAVHLTAHASAVAAIAFSGDGAKLATADAEGTIKVWQDPEKLNATSASLYSLKGHQGAILALGFSNDGKRLISSSADRTARVWDLANPDAAIRPLERSTSLYMARFSPDGLLIAAAGSRGINLWDASNGRLVKELPTADQSLIHSVAFSPIDNRLLAVGYGGLPGGQAGVSHVVLWDIESATELARLAGATDVPGLSLAQDMGAVSALAFSPDGKYLAAGFGTKRLFALTGSPSPLKV